MTVKICLRGPRGPLRKFVLQKPAPLLYHYSLLVLAFQDYSKKVSGGKYYR